MVAPIKSNSKPLSVPSDIYDRLNQCKIIPNESFGSIIERHIDEHLLLHLLLEDPEKVIEAIKNANTIIQKRTEIIPILQKPEVMKLILGSKLHG